MIYRLIVTETAYADLDAISAWVESQADRAIADAYDARLRARIDALAHFPNRGSPRRRWGSAVRSMSFERRIVIVYRVENDVVEVLRVLRGARDLDALLG